MLRVFRKDNDACNPIKMMGLGHDFSADPQIHDLRIAAREISWLSWRKPQSKRPRAVSNSNFPPRIGR
jgi:hypothetical protein